MPTLTERIALVTLVAPGHRCQQCRCGAYLTPRQARRDGVCPDCADAPACSDIATQVIVDYDIAKIRAEQEADADLDRAD